MTADGGDEGMETSNLWRKTLIYLGLVEEPEEHDEYERTRSQREDPAGRRSRGTDTAQTRRSRRGGRATRDRDDQVRPLRPPAERPAHVRPVDGGVARVAIVRASTFDDAETVGERYRTGQPVLVDLGDVDTRTGRRLLDFVSGVTYALRGRIVPAGGRAFLLLPDQTEVPADERRRLADVGYHLQFATAPDEA